MQSRRAGFTLTEVLVALVLFAIVSTAIYQLLVNNQRLYRSQAAKVDVAQNVRAAVSILPDDLRELDANDPAGSDILGMTATALTYKAMRSFYYVCAQPTITSPQIILAKGSFYGLAALTNADSLLIFAEKDSTTQKDNVWLHAAVLNVSTGSACPVGTLGGTASLTVTVDPITQALLGGVYKGTPVRGFDASQVLLYTDANGAYWLGSRTYSRTSGWSTTQPLVGPLTSSGLQFAYYDKNGAVTGTATSVARIGIAVTGKSSAPVVGRGSSSYITQGLVTSVALRNNR